MNTFFCESSLAEKFSKLRVGNFATVNIGPVLYTSDDRYTRKYVHLNDDLCRKPGAVYTESASVFGAELELSLVNSS